jgi:lipopolysaccharide transport system ATP-binding protein
MDEVLAVGDLNFQKKCFDYILKLKRNGTAIILVSHSPGAIWSVCDRGVFMNRGGIEVDGPVEDAIRAYDDQNSRNAALSSTQFAEATATQHGSTSPGTPAEYGHSQGGTGDIVCTAVRLLNSSLTPTGNEFEFMESMVIEAEFTVENPIDELLLRFTIDAAHYRFIATLDSYEQGLDLPRVDPGNYRLRVHLNAPNFRPGSYTLNVGVSRKGVGVHLFYWFGASRFLVKHPSTLFLYADSNAVMHLDGKFSLQTVSPEVVAA